MHVVAIHASINPFHPPTARSPLLLLSLLSIPNKTTSLPKPTIKGSPSETINVTVSILPKTAERAEIIVGYVDGKVETIPIESPAANVVTKKIKDAYPRTIRKNNEAISLDKLILKVDGWARSLKLKDEGSA
jgi:hypothetical protein